MQTVRPAENKTPAGFTGKISAAENNFNRAEIVKAINEMGLLTYKVRSVKIMII